MGLGCSRCGQLVSSVSALSVPRLFLKGEDRREGILRSLMSRLDENESSYRKGPASKGSSGAVDELLKLPGVLIHF